jgi:galactofuranose transport system substrate-binding protein
MKTLRKNGPGKIAIFALGLFALGMLSGCAALFGTNTETKSVVAPTFSPAAGSYNAAQTVTIASTTEGATIRYTNDGTTPTDTYGMLYTAPLNVNATMTIKAIAYRGGWTSSTVSTSAYVISAASSNWVVGFSQLGSESDWRDADTRSIQNSFNADLSFTLIYSDGQNHQANQITALRSFISRKVDCILFTAIVESGFGAVLQEAKDANIPVIMIDRDVQQSDRALRASIIGSDFVAEGEKAGTWLADYLTAQGIDNGTNTINIVELEGTTGSAPAIDRKTGFANISEQHTNWQISQSQTANFTTAEGKTVMASFLAADRTIRVLYAHNDGMALGAVQAIKEAGLIPGTDIIVIGIDAVKPALQAIVDGDMNCTVECSPLIGPQALQAVKDLRNGTTLPNRIWTNEGLFDATNAAAALPTREY